MAKRTGGAAGEQVALLKGEVATLRDDIDTIVDIVNWQMRSMGRLKELLYTCELEHRPPKREEISLAVRYWDQRQAA
jgi:hypothetical protein